MKFTGARMIPRILAALALTAASGMLAAMWFASSAINGAEVERLEATVRTMADSQRQRTAQLVLDYASWDDAWIHLSESLDRPWAADNIGSWLYEEQGITRVAVAAADGTLRLMIRDGALLERPPEAGAVNGVRAAILWAVEQPVEAGAVARTMMLDGAPVHVAAAPIVGHTEAVTAKVGPEPDRLLFFRPVNIASFETAVEGRVAAVPMEDAPPMRSGMVLGTAVRVLAQPSPRTVPPVALVVEVALSGRALTLKLGLPIAALLGLVVGLAWWAGRLAMQEYAQRHLLDAQNRELLASREALIQAAEAKARYHRMMAHELRSPLSVIVAGAQMLEGQGNPPGAAGAATAAGNTYARFIGIAAAQLHAMIDDLLDLARVQAGALVLEPGTIAVADVIGRVIAGLDAQAKETGITLRRSVTEREAMLTADPHVLERVVYNLLAAAMRDAPASSVLTLVTEVRDSDLHIRLTAVDAQGGALPLAMRHDGRLGLGLPFCEAMLVELGGRLDLEDPDGEAAAAIILPLAA